MFVAHAVFAISISMLVSKTCLELTIHSFTTFPLGLLEINYDAQLPEQCLFHARFNVPGASKKYGAVAIFYEWCNILM